MKQAKAPRTLTLVERKAFRDAYRGKVLLDATDPNWTEAVSSSRLRMGCPWGQCGCVLGQWMYDSETYDQSDYWDGLDALGLGDGKQNRLPVEVHYGFNSGIYSTEHNAGNLTDITHLQRAWTYILRLLGR